MLLKLPTALRSPEDGGTAGGESQPDPQADSGAGSDVEMQASPQPESGGEKQEGKPHWKDQRIDQLTKNWRQTERDKITLEQQLTLANAELERLRNGKTDGQQQQGKTVLSEEEIERRAEERALAKAQQIEFNRRCNAAFAEGTQEYKDFADVVKNMQQTLDENYSPTFLSAALETGAAHHVLHHLGQDLNEAFRIAKLPPLAMAVEMAKIAGAQGKAKAPSKAPPPVNGAVRGSGASTNEDPEKMSMAEWMAWRESELKAKRA